jgi:hypothetical protein
MKKLILRFRYLIAAALLVSVVLVGSVLMTSKSEVKVRETYPGGVGHIKLIPCQEYYEKIVKAKLNDPKKRFPNPYEPRPACATAIPH